MKNTKIEWADLTWNPVSGCLHGCEYCYAKRIATRFSHTKDWDACPENLEDEICRAADRNLISVFMKDSLVPIMGEKNMRRELPWC